MYSFAIMTFKAKLRLVSILGVKFSPYLVKSVPSSHERHAQAPVGGDFGDLVILVWGRNTPTFCNVNINFERGLCQCRRQARSAQPHGSQSELGWKISLVLIRATQKRYSKTPSPSFISVPRHNTLDHLGCPTRLSSRQFVAFSQPCIDDLPGINDHAIFQPYRCGKSAPRSKR
jgi:hypothetical protein